MIKNNLFRACSCPTYSRQGSFITVFFGLFLFLTLLACERQDATSENKAIETTQAPIYNKLKQLTLPENINVIVGQSLKIYFDDIVLVDNINNYDFNVLVDGNDVVLTNDEYWEFFANPEDVGGHKLEIIVNDLTGENVDYGVSNIRVSNVPASINRQINILVIGDSLTAGGEYVSDLGDKILSVGINDLNFIGTVSSFGYNYEGYGGNTWSTFYEAVSSKSPFVYLDAGLDFDRYFAESLNGELPEYCIIFLGTNDIFTTDGSEVENINDRAAELFQTAELFISELKSTLPAVKIIVTTIVVPNIRSEAFVANYGNKYTRDNYRKVQHVFVRLQQDYFSNREDENIYLIPAYYGVDSFNGFPEDNALHPNAFGYSQIADMFFNEFMYIFSLN